MSASPDELRAILARLEAAEGPDRELDALVIVAAGVASEVNPRSPMFVRMLDEHGKPDDLYTRSAEVTASLDAAVALAERVLPGTAWGVSVEPPTPHGALTYHAFVAEHWPTKPTGRWNADASYCQGSALALCISLVRALLSRAEPAGAPSHGMSTDGDRNG